jgi:uncharacterized repeat protein (TIGR01451 family)
MTSKLKTLVASTSVMALLFSGAPAMAEGTQAGTPIENSVSVTFQVNGQTQTAPPVASNTFVVDRKIIFDVNATDTVSTTVNPNSTENVLTFTLENTSNDTLDFALSIANLANGFSTTNGDAGVDNFTADNIYYCVDNNGNNVCDAGEENVNVNDLAPDSTRTVWVYGDFPITTPNAAVAAVSLTAVGLTSAGAALSDDSGVADDTAAVQNVFADTDENNTETADDNFLAAAAVLSVSKLSRVVSDPISGTTNPKAIPGATIEYCITVNNTGSAVASNVVITDDLDQVSPAAEYDPAFTPLRNGTGVTTGVCDANGTGDAAAYVSATNDISSTLASVPAGEIRTLIFRVTIQ